MAKALTLCGRGDASRGDGVGPEIDSCVFSGWAGGKRVGKGSRTFMYYGFDHDFDERRVEVLAGRL